MGAGVPGAHFREGAMQNITVRILLDGRLVATRSVEPRSAETEDADHAAKGEALRSAIREGQLTISEALRATVEVSSAPPAGAPHMPLMTKS
jgi:hypothetical protein